VGVKDWPSMRATLRLDVAGEEPLITISPCYEWHVN